MADAIKSGAVQAFADGKPVQFNYKNQGWTNFNSSLPGFLSVETLWCPAPTPRLRPWKDGSEVPKQAIYREKGWMEGCWSLILGVSSAGIWVPFNSRVVTVGFNNALEHGEYSLDGGKTWAPCGVQEGGE